MVKREKTLVDDRSDKHQSSLRAPRSGEQKDYDNLTFCNLTKTIILLTSARQAALRYPCCGLGRGGN